MEISTTISDDRVSRALYPEGIEVEEFPEGLSAKLSRIEVLAPVRAVRVSGTITIEQIEAEIGCRQGG